MARKTNLSDDLAILAAEDRERFSESPTAEQLIAYRDGRLAEDEANRVRDRLAVDPELAELYLDLKRFPDLETGASENADSATGADGAWRKLSARLDREPLIAEGILAREVKEESQVIAFPRRRSRSRLLALAATLVLAAGLVWFSAQRRLSVGRLPDGAYHDVYVDQTLFRGSSLEVPRSAVGVAMRLDTTELERPGRFVVELLDASGQQIQRRREDLRADQQTLVFRVASSSLKDGGAYQLTIGSSQAPPSDPPAFKATFTVVFGDFELSELPRVPAGPCDDLDPTIDSAVGLRRQGDREAARARYMETLNLAIESRCLHQEARVRNGLGTLATFEGRLLDGLRIFDRALSTLRQSKPAQSEDPALAAKAAQLEARIELNRGSAFLRLGQLDDASDAHRRVRSLYGRHGASPRQWALALIETARTHRLRGQSLEAGEAAREALRRLEGKDPKLHASLWQELAWLYLEEGRFDEAEQAHEQAFASLETTSDLISMASLLADRAELAARRGQWAKCLEEAEKALRSKAAAGTPDLHLETHARYLQSLALWEMGEKKPARLASAAGLAMLEALHSGWQEFSIPFFAQRQRYYRHHLDIAASIDGPEQAWSVFESYRARGLLESSALQADHSRSSPDSTLRQQWEQRLAELVEAVSALDRWDRSDDENVLDHREALFRKRLLALRQLRAEIFPAWGSKDSHQVSPEAVSKILDDATLALSFAAGESHLYALAVDHARGLESRTLNVTGGQVEDLVEKILRRLDPHASPDIRPELDAYVDDLSELLLSPIADLIGGFRRLVIVTDGPLERLPFEVLRHPRTRSRLIKTHEIVYLPSFSFLVATADRLRACPRPAKPLLAMGDPIFGPSDPRWPAGVPGPRNDDDQLAWGPLPASSGEVEALARLYSGETTTALGFDATRRRFLTEAPKHRVLHIASHARSHSEVPERSRIALSCVDARDQVLETCDLYFVDAVNLELCGQVVVLSACETAGGRSLDGEGILGLPWAFLHAGASTVVTSLWQVADEHTAELMSSFHRHLSAGEGPATALRQAKLERLDVGAEPSAWAPFIVVGNWRINASFSTFSK